MKKFVTIAILIFSVQPICAQQLPSATEQQLENLSDVTEEETEDDTYLQQLQYLLLHPLNVNAATAEELQALRLLTPLQIENFIQYRKLFQNLISLYELQAVPLWDVTTIRKLLPYITISAKIENIGSRFVNGDHSLLLRNTRILEKQKGFNRTLPTHFAGDQNHLLFRYKYQYKNELQYGIVGDKDAGEAFFNGTQKSGFDFYSFHFFARKLGVIKALAVGDFTINMGQGLLQWQALAFKKSSEPLAVVRQSPTLMPYHSAGEALFNRGAGITLQKGVWETTVFASFRNSSANLASDSSADYFTSFSNSGLHRTPFEIADKGSIRQTAIGGVIKLHLSRFNISVNAVNYHFSKPLQKRDEPYNLYAINGSGWHNGSVDYNGVFKNIYVFGEAAVDKRGNGAFINGAMASVDPKVDVSLVHRHISPQYQALYGNAFTENIAPTNERGLYAGIAVRPTPAWRLNGYADFFGFPWLKYRVDAPSRGQDYLLQLTYQPNKKLEAYARFRQEQKGLNALTADSVMHFVSPKRRQNIRLHVAYNVSRSLTFKSRGEVMLYDVNGNDSEEGYLIFFETAYGVLKKLKGNVRLQYFDTDGYNSRIYAYESDVLYSYSVPAFFDTGFRYYFNLQYDVFKKGSVWLRWSQAIYTNQQAIGSGLTSIAGNTRSEIKCQASYRF
jgi:DNA uptake protein ComE-like DNA-binding protein